MICFQTNMLQHGWKYETADLIFPVGESEEQYLVCLEKILLVRDPQKVE